MVESLIFIGAGVGAGEKNTRSRSRLKTDRLHNTEQFNKRNPSIVNLLTQKKKSINVSQSRIMKEDRNSDGETGKSVSCPPGCSGSGCSWWPAGRTGPWCWGSPGSSAPGSPSETPPQPSGSKTSVYLLKSCWLASFAFSFINIAWVGSTATVTRHSTKNTFWKLLKSTKNALAELCYKICSFKKY